MGWAGIVAHDFSSQEAEAGGSLSLRPVLSTEQVVGEPGRHRERDPLGLGQRVGERNGDGKRTSYSLGSGTARPAGSADLGAASPSQGM